MMGIVAVHLAGRMTTGVLDGDDATHMAVMFGPLLLLAGMGLMGRHDLGLRIPSALEAVCWVFWCLTALRPYWLAAKSPFHSSPTPSLETPLSWTNTASRCRTSLACHGWRLLIGSRVNAYVVTYPTIEPQREEVHGSLGHRFSPSALRVDVPSFLPCAEVLLGAQPAVMLTAVLCLPLMLQSFTPWAFEPLGLEVTPTLTATAVGLASVVWASAVVLRDQGLWLSSSLWAVHLLLYPAALMSQSLVWLTLAGLNRLNNSVVMWHPHAEKVMAHHRSG